MLASGRRRRRTSRGIAPAGRPTRAGSPRCRWRGRSSRRAAGSTARTTGRPRPGGGAGDPRVGDPSPTRQRPRAPQHHPAPDDQDGEHPVADGPDHALPREVQDRLHDGRISRAGRACCRGCWRRRGSTGRGRGCPVPANQRWKSGRSSRPRKRGRRSSPAGASRPRRTVGPTPPARVLDAGQPPAPRLPPPSQRGRFRERQGQDDQVGGRLPPYSEPAGGGVGVSVAGQENRSGGQERHRHHAGCGHRLSHVVRPTGEVERRASGVEHPHGGVRVVRAGGALPRGWSSCRSS